MLAAVPPRRAGKVGELSFFSDLVGRARGLSALLVRSLPCAMSEGGVGDVESKDPECKRSVRRRLVEWRAPRRRELRGSRTEGSSAAAATTSPSPFTLL